MSFVKHSMQMMMWRAVTMVVATTTVVLLARWLGPVDRGDLAILVLSLSLAALVIQFGLPEAIVYVVGAKRFADKQIISSILVYLFSLSALVAIPGYWVLTRWLHLDIVISGLLLATVVLINFVTIFRHVLLAQKNFSLYSVSTVLELLTYLAVLILLKEVGALSVDTALLAYALSQFSALVLLLLCQYTSGNTLISLTCVRPAIIAYCYRYGFHLFVTGLGGFGVRRINYFLLDLFLGSRAVGLFAAANSIPTVFSSLPQQLSIVLYSHVASRSSEDYGVRLTVLVFKLLAGVCILLIVPIALFAEPLARLLFGAEFDGIGRTMIILTVGMASAGLGSLLYNSLAGTGLPKYGSHMTFINVGMVTALAYLWIPIAGIEGAAWANLVTSLVNLIFVGAVFCREFRVGPNLFWGFSKAELGLLRASILDRG